MKKNDFVLPILIILLLFFVPATIYGVNKHNSGVLDKDNPKHLPKKDGKLYFYDSNDTLVGTYECKEEKLCNAATTSIDDNNNLHYEGESTTLPVYNGAYAFIQDGTQIYYYWLKNNMNLLTLNMVKDYGIGLSGGLLILQDEYFKYGLFDPNTGSFIIEPIYDFMGVTSQYLDEDGKLSVEKLIVQKDGMYYLIDEAENALTAKIANPIYAFDDDVLYSVTDLGNYSVLNYQGEKRIAEDFRVMKFLENSNALITTDYLVRIYSKDFINLFYDKKYDTFDLNFTESDDEVIITNLDNETLDTVALTVDNVIDDEQENPEESEENSEEIDGEET